MAEDRKTDPPPLRRRQPSRPSLDDSELARQLDERDRHNAQLLAQLEAAKAQVPQRRAPESVAPKSGDIKVQASGSAKSWASLLLGLAGLGVGGGAWLDKAPQRTVENQGATIAVTREDLNGVVSRVEALERKDRKRDVLERSTMDYTIQVLEEGKVAIVRRPQGLPPMKPIDTHWPRPLPGRHAVAPILIVDTPYPTIEWVSE
jgi:hypothetical protein